LLHALEAGFGSTFTGIYKLGRLTALELLSVVEGLDIFMRVWKWCHW